MAWTNAANRVCPGADVPGRTWNGGTNDSIHVRPATVPFIRASWAPVAVVGGCRRGYRHRAGHDGRGRLSGCAGAARFRQVNLVSNIPGVAPLTDPDLVNAWGLAASPGTDQKPGTPLWVSDNGTDKTTLFVGATPTSVAQLLVVNVTAGAPTGQAFNPDSSGFIVHDAAGHSGSALFMFASENGAIDGWSQGGGATGPGPSIARRSTASHATRLHVIDVTQMC